MPALHSSMLFPLGQTAYDFTLLDVVSNSMKSLHDLRSKYGTVIIFMCNHCPFVHHIQSALVDVAYRYQQQGVQFIGINSNDPDQYPEDAPERMREVAKTQSYPFPYLFDADQKVARQYHATCTPDFFVLDQHMCCVYRGRFDASRPSLSEKIPDGKDLCTVLDKLLAHEPIDPDQKPSIGCSIKWREPEQ